MMLNLWLDVVEGDIVCIYAVLKVMNVNDMVSVVLIVVLVIC